MVFANACNTQLPRYSEPTTNTKPSLTPRVLECHEVYTLDVEKLRRGAGGSWEGASLVVPKEEGRGPLRSTQPKSA